MEPENLLHLSSAVTLRRELEGRQGPVWVERRPAPLARKAWARSRGLGPSPVLTTPQLAILEGDASPVTSCSTREVFTFRTVSSLVGIHVPASDVTDTAQASSGAHGLGVMTAHISRARKLRPREVKASAKVTELVTKKCFRSARCRVPGTVPGSSPTGPLPPGFPGRPARCWMGGGGAQWAGGTKIGAPGPGLGGFPWEVRSRLSPEK